MAFEIKKLKNNICIILIRGQNLIYTDFLRREFLKILLVVNDSKFMNLSQSF